MTTFEFDTLGKTSVMHNSNIFDFQFGGGGGGGAGDLELLYMGKWGGGVLCDKFRGGVYSIKIGGGFGMLMQIFDEWGNWKRGLLTNAPVRVG